MQHAVVLYIIHNHELFFKTKLCACQFTLIMNQFVSKIWMPKKIKKKKNYLYILFFLPSHLISKHENEICDHCDAFLNLFDSADKWKIFDSRLWSFLTIYLEHKKQDIYFYRFQVCIQYSVKNFLYIFRIEICFFIYVSWTQMNNLVTRDYWDLNVQSASNRHLFTFIFKRHHITK